MDTLSGIPDTSYELPLSEADQAALRPALLRDLGAMPFMPGAPISRSLWVIFIGEADTHIFRQVRQAAARRETAPWAFHVAGPIGTREVTGHEARQDPARTPARHTGVSRRVPGGRRQPW